MASLQAGSAESRFARLRQPITFRVHGLMALFCYLLPELGMFICIKPAPGAVSLLLGLLYGLVLTGICLILPKIAGMLFFAVSSVAVTVWAMAQIVYYDLFGRLMWINDAAYASDGVIFIDDVLTFYAPPLWWVVVIVDLSFFLLALIRWPGRDARSRRDLRAVCLGMGAALCLLCLAERSDLVGATVITQGTLPVYHNSGYYHLLKEDVRAHWLADRLPGRERAREEAKSRIDRYFSERGAGEENAMTGILAGKNVIVFIMESLDDWMITPQQMPTVSAMMEESIVFTDFYTPFYGTTRSINTEVCINSGLYFPSDGSYFYDFLGNCFDQSLPNVLGEQGYTSQVFHHNYPEYYRRAELIPAIGYDLYNSYIVEAGQETVLNDSYPFDSLAMRSRFFREGRTFNMLITQAAHLPYGYDDPMSAYALEKHPEYLGAFGSEEEDCIRAKARLIDDTLARLLAELEKEGTLEDTVIIALSDHYPYGYSDTGRLLEYAGSDGDALLLDNTPCFIWSADMEPMKVDKTLQTADLLPTILNLLGIGTEYSYPGRDAFDPNYEGYAFFPDGSWASGGVVCRKTVTADGEETVVAHSRYGKEISDEWVRTMTEASRAFTEIGNLILSSDYYRE